MVSKKASPGSQCRGLHCPQTYTARSFLHQSFTRSRTHASCQTFGPSGHKNTRLFFPPPPFPLRYLSYALMPDFTMCRTRSLYFYGREKKTKLDLVLSEVSRGRACGEVYGPLATAKRHTSATCTCFLLTCQEFGFVLVVYWFVFVCTSKDVCDVFVAQISMNNLSPFF